MRKDLKKIPVELVVLIMKYLDGLVLLEERNYERRLKSLDDFEFIKMKLSMNRVNTSDLWEMTHVSTDENTSKALLEPVRIKPLVKFFQLKVDQTAYLDHYLAFTHAEHQSNFLNATHGFLSDDLETIDSDYARTLCVSENNYYFDSTFNDAYEHIHHRRAYALSRGRDPWEFMNTLHPIMSTERIMELQWDATQRRSPDEIMRKHTELSHSVRYRLRKMVFIKAAILLAMTNQQIVRAEDNMYTRQKDLWTSVWRLTSDFLEARLSFLTRVFSYLVSCLPEDTRSLRTIVETLFLMSLLWLLFKIMRCGIKRFTANWVYVPRAGGDILPGTKIVVNERAIEGSDYTNSSKKQVAALMVANDKRELSIVGMCFRLGERLVTAGHVAARIDGGTDEVYMVGLREERNLIKLNLRSALKLEREAFSMERNEFKYTLDIHAFRLEPRMWARVGLATVSTRVGSQYGLNVSVVGFPDGDVLKVSHGMTLVGSGSKNLFHSASTKPGFSGTPIFCGNAVVGVHTSADSDRNIGIRIETVKFGLREFEESYIPNIEIIENGVKFNGRQCYVEDFGENDYAFLARDGRVDYIDHRTAEEMGFDRQLSAYAEFLLEEETPDERGKRVSSLLNRRSKNWYADYDDEHGDGIVKLGKLSQEIINEAEHWLEFPSEKPVHCNSTLTPKVEASAYIDEQGDKLVKLGYDETKYGIPEINPHVEETSTKNHLKLYSERVKTIKHEPTESEMRRCAMLVSQQVAGNAFVPDENYKTKEKMIEIIHSSAVNESKSPGHPYQAQGMTTNGQVIKALGVPGLTQAVLDNWDAEVELKTFCKAEPTKQNKLKDGMCRIIAGLPLHKMIKHQAIFGQMLNVAVENWKNTPIKYAFVPSKPGHIEHLASLFKGKKVVESDKTNWDFNFFNYIYLIIIMILPTLVKRPVEWTDEQMEEYLKDVEGSFHEVANAKYRLTNGKVIAPKTPGIMRSGFLLTIFANSLGQVVVDTLIKIRMGLTDEEILDKEHVMVAGGDDVIQIFPENFDQEKYVSKAKDLGFSLELINHESFNGTEFFSTKYTIHNGVWIYKPLRFTKHVAKLKCTKLEDLPMALSSHMINYCWDTPRFTFFERMFLSFRKLHPALFTLNLCHNQMTLRYKSKGYEAVC